MSSNFRNPFYNKRPNFLSQLEQSKVLTFLSSHVLMKTHFELKIMLMSGLFLETQVNVVVVVTIIAKTRMYSKFSFLTRTDK